MLHLATELMFCNNLIENQVVTRSYNKIMKKSALSLIWFFISTFYLLGQATSLIVIDPLAEIVAGNFNSTVPGQVVITLPDEGNPLKFIANKLKQSQYDEIHLYVLTKPGSIIFDEINITPENFGDYSADFSEWKSISKPESTIIIHSENLISGQEGQLLINKIKEFTGRAVIVEK